MTRLEMVLKRSLDVAGALLGIAILAPVFTVVAAGVALDSPGPVLFRQRRLGLDGRHFMILKFRTMKADSSVVIGPTGTVLNFASDPRHTRVGRVLRRLSLDEIPQLFNVLAGDMSLVGPRPDLPEALSLYRDNQRTKLSVRPGITGLSQISGRNALSAEEKWCLDAKYAADASLWLDATIVARTILRVLRRSDVY